jgi:hypothetical protein
MSIFFLRALSLPSILPASHADCGSISPAARGGVSRGVAHVRDRRWIWRPGKYALRPACPACFGVPRCGGGGTPNAYWSMLWRTPPST